MLKIAKTTALVLAAVSPVLAVAQGSQGRADRKPSPATSAASTQGRQPGTQATSGSQQFVTSENFYRANSKSNAAANSVQPAAPQLPVRPAPAIQARPVAQPVIGPASVATSVSAPIPQAAAAPTSSPETTATVNYTQGQLTVISQNASLGTVLKLISAKTGAVIDLAPELQNEPVIAHMGPSAVREVLTGLLDSPRVDYIILGAGDASGAVDRIVVRTRQSFARTAMATGRPSQPRPQELETEAKLEENGPPAVATTPHAPLTQEQLMENWKKIREEKRLAEIEQQRQDRENESNGVQVQPPPQPDNPPTDNPPPQ